MIRFTITRGDADPIVTEWEDEPLTSGMAHTAVQRVNDLRQTYGGDAAIAIERTTLIPEADRQQVRFKIVDGDVTAYSIPFPIAEKDARLADMQVKFPNATVTEEIVK